MPKKKDVNDTMKINNVPRSRDGKLSEDVILAMIILFSLSMMCSVTMVDMVVAIFKSRSLLSLYHSDGNNTAIRNRTFTIQPILNNSPTEKKKTTTTKKPHLILHIGPSKTATTTIQTLLAMNQQLLGDDGYDLAGYQIPSSSPLISQYLYDRLLTEKWECWNYSLSLQWAESLSGADITSSDGQEWQSMMQNEPCWQRLSDQLDEIRHKNIILSNEAMSHGYKRFMYKRYPHGLLQLQLFSKELHSRWNVHLVICYRRYYEWLLSALKEQNAKLLNRKDRGRLWPNEGGKNSRLAWPQMQRWMEHPDSIVDRYHYQYPDRSKDIWGNAGFHNIHIVNFHSPGGTDDPSRLFEHFICDIVPHANETCNRARQLPQSLHVNVRNVDTTIYDQIVCDAKMLLSNLSGLPPHRNVASRTLQEYHQVELGRSWTDLPLNCPSKLELQRLLNVSLEKERLLVPDFFHDHMEGHMSNFWMTAYEKKAYCSVDTTTLFRNKTSWHEVLNSLN